MKTNKQYCVWGVIDTQKCINPQKNSIHDYYDDQDRATEVAKGLSRKYPLMRFYATQVLQPLWMN